MGGLLTFVLAVGTLTGCTNAGMETGGNGPAEPTPSTTRAAGGDAPTLWEQTISRLGPDGRLGRDAALAAYTLAIGPLPGVERPGGNTDDIVSGTIAVRSVLAHWNELTGPQRDAVLKALGTKLLQGAPSGGGALGAPVRTPNPNLACQTADSAGAGPYRELVDDAIAKISARLGRSLSIQTTVTVDTTEDIEEAGPDAWMYTYPCAGVMRSDHVADGRVTGCTIHLRPRSTLAANFEADVRGPLVHEVMHCFIFQKFGLAPLPDWYAEGVPSWAMGALGPPNQPLANHWAYYLRHPNLPLEGRTYDGMGFFVHLAETGTDPWKVIDPMGRKLRDGTGTPEAWRASGMSSSFEETWGSGFVQDPSRGKAWMSTGPNLAASVPRFEQETIANGDTRSVVSNPTAARMKRLSIAAEVVQVDPSPAAKGRISLSVGTDVTLDVARSATYCALGGSACTCPPDSERAGTKFTPMERGEQYAGVTGGLENASVSVSGQSLEDFCGKPGKPGKWRAVSVTSRSTLPQGPGNSDWHWNVDGGAGIKLTIDPKGKVSVDYTGMRKLSYTIPEVRQAGTVICTGVDKGSLPAKSFSGSGGAWQPTIGAIGSSGTIDVTSPTRLRQSASPGSGGCRSIFRADPFHAGTWKRTPKSLTIIASENSPAGGRISTVWTFAPA
ncbi:hypothetical protein GCM10027569_41400 [Flindersiella endophytica]